MYVRRERGAHANRKYASRLSIRRNATRGYFVTTRWREWTVEYSANERGKRDKEMKFATVSKREQERERERERESAWWRPFADEWGRKRGTAGGKRESTRLPSVWRSVLLGARATVSAKAAAGNLLSIVRIKLSFLSRLGECRLVGFRAAFFFFFSYHRLPSLREQMHFREHSLRARASERVAASGAYSSNLPALTAWPPLSIMSPYLRVCVRKRIERVETRESRNVLRRIYDRASLSSTINDWRYDDLRLTRYIVSIPSDFSTFILRFIVLSN